MSDPVLQCPHARYVDGMRVFCTLANDYCGNAYYKRCKGWWALTPRWPMCPLLKE